MRFAWYILGIYVGDIFEIYMRYAWDEITEILWEEKKVCDWVSEKVSDHAMKQILYDTGPPTIVSLDPPSDDEECQTKFPQPKIEEKKCPSFWRYITDLVR